MMNSLGRFRATAQPISPTGQRRRQAVGAVERLESRRLLTVTYAATDLRDLTGGISVEGYRPPVINDNGDLGVSPSVFTSPEAQVFHNGAVIPVAGVNVTRLYGINNSLEVVGNDDDGGFIGQYSADPNPHYDLVRPTTPAGMHLGLTALNDAGAAVGAGPSYIDANGAYHDLGSFGYGGEAEEISDTGLIAGSADANEPALNRQDPRAFLWDGTIHDLGTLGGNESDGYGINDAGVVVGKAQNAAGAFHAFLFDQSMHDLGTLPDGIDSTASAINDSGIVVGYSDSPVVPGKANQHALVYDGTMHDLNELTSNLPPGWVLQFPTQVKNDGRIIVSAVQVQNGKAADQTFFLLTPNRPAPSRITGTVWNDANHNGIEDAGEAGLAGVTVFLDLNQDGRLDPGDPTATTDSTGTYLFPTVQPGTYSVRQVVPSGYAVTAPQGYSGTATVGADATAAGPDFGDVRLSSVPLDFSYLLTIAQHYGQPGTFADGDLNGDGRVNFDDLLLLAQNYGHPLAQFAKSVRSSSGHV